MSTEFPVTIGTFADEQHGWMVADHARLLATTDGGQTWAPLPIPAGLFTGGIRFFTPSFGRVLVNNQQQWAWLETCDGGTSWQQLYPPLEPLRPDTQPGPDRGASTAASVTEQLLALLKALSPQQAVQMQDKWGMPGIAVFCAGTGESAEETVLACQWGKGYNTMQDGRALFWWEDGSWNTQPYPPDGVSGMGDFRGLRREGDLLQVIMNVSGGQTLLVEQVGLLQYAGGKWQAVWGPMTSSPPARRSLVLRPPRGIARYSLFRDEEEAHVREDWQREGSNYVRARRVELSQEEYVVVRFALALLSQNELELTYWAAPQALESAQHLDLAQALRGGFTTRRGTGGVVQLDPVGQADSWHMTVTRKDGFWKVTAIQ